MTAADKQSTTSHAAWQHPVVVLGAVALLLRCGWILVQWLRGSADPNTWFPDEQLHWQIAQNLVERGEFVTDDGRHAPRMPLYPLFLTLFATLGSTGVLLARLAQALLGAATVVLVTRCGQRVAGVRGAWLAGVLAACDPFGVYFANLLLTEVPFTLLLVAFVTQCFAMVDPARPPRRLTRPAIWIAILGAAGILTRPSAALLIPAGWLAVWWLSQQRGRAARYLLLSPVVLAAALLPWGLRNQAVLGGFAWLSANGGVTLYDAQGPQADGSSDQSFLQDMRQNPQFRELDELQRDAYLQQRALEQMQRDPRRVVELAGVKILRTWSLTPNVPAAWPIALASAVHTLATLLAAGVGLSRSLRAPQRRRLQTLLWLCVVYFTLLHAVYIGSIRYRLPLMPLLALAAAPALARPRSD